MGDVVLLELLKARELLPKFDGAADVFCLIEDESLRSDSLKLIQQLREAGLAVEYSLTPAKPDKQFKRAQEMRASRTVRLERNAAGGLVVRARELRTREEQTLTSDEIVKTLKPLKG